MNKAVSIKNSIKLLLPDLLICFSFSFVLAFFAPLDFYYSNKDDLWYDVFNIFGYVALIAISTFFVLVLLLLLLKKIPHAGPKLSHVFQTFIIFLLVAFYIQGNIMPLPYGAINGTPIPWDDYKIYDYTGIFVWLCILLVVVLVRIKLPKYEPQITKYLCLYVVFISVLTLSYEYFLSDGLIYKYEKSSTTNNEWLYSNNQNFNILLLDCLDSRLFYDTLLNDEEMYSLAEDLDGFTFYKDTMGCYNLTDYSIPAILTGQLYLGDTTYGEFINSSYNSSPLLQKLTKDNWQNNIYTTITLPQSDAMQIDIANLDKIRLEPIYTSKFIYDMYRMVGFRYLPSILKHPVYTSFFEVGANRQAVKTSNNSATPFDWNNMLWNNGHQEYGFTYTDQSVFHFYHLQGIHSPRQYHSDYSFTTDPSEVGLDEGNKLCFKIISTWINHLKKENLYDNSVIIIMGDHGSVEYLPDETLGETPLLLIKGYNEHHEMYFNKQYISYLDLQNAFVNLLDGASSSEAFSNTAVETGGLRMFYFTYLMNEMRTNSIGGPFYEYATPNSIYVKDSLVSTGFEY